MTDTDSDDLVADLEEAMRDVVDPELGINVVDLGLVYDVHLDESSNVVLDMTLTSAACPLTDVISFKGAGLAGMVARGVADEMWSAEFAAGVAFRRDPVTAEPDVLEMALRAGEDEFLVVATDGLWDVMSSQEAVTLARNDLRRGRHPGEVAERLAGLAVRR